MMKILIVLTSHSELGDTGKKTGFWVEEFAAPYYELADAGAEITLASPRGGQPRLIPKARRLKRKPNLQSGSTRMNRSNRNSRTLSN